MGMEKLQNIAREHKYLSNKESAIFQTAVTGLFPIKTLNKDFKHKYSQVWNIYCFYYKID